MSHFLLFPGLLTPLFPTSSSVGINSLFTEKIKATRRECQHATTDKSISPLTNTMPFILL